VLSFASRLLLYNEGCGTLVSAEEGRLRRFRIEMKAVTGIIQGFSSLGLPLPWLKAFLR
jgi:hypothetical protein